MEDGVAMKARVIVTLKNGLLDPQGKAIEGALKSLDIRRRRKRAAGQDFRRRTRRRTIAAGAEALLKEACEKLLANQVVENYASRLA